MKITARQLIRQVRILVVSINLVEFVFLVIYGRTTPVDLDNHL